MSPKLTPLNSKPTSPTRSTYKNPLEEFYPWEDFEKSLKIFEKNSSP